MYGENENFVAVANLLSHRYVVFSLSGGWYPWCAHRLVLCGLCSRHISVPHTDNLLVMLGFHQRTPTIVRAFHERYF